MCAHCLYCLLFVWLQSDSCATMQVAIGSLRTAGDNAAKGIVDTGGAA